MKYKITLNKKVYEVEVESGEAILAAEYDAAAPVAAPAAAPAPAPVAAPAAAPAPAPAAAPAAAPAPAAPAAPAAPVAAGEAFPAPLPGVVVDVKISAGDKVSAGQVVMIVEAMKMENEITAPRDCTIAQVVASKGQSIQSGDTLFVMG